MMMMMMMMTNLNAFAATKADAHSEAGYSIRERPKDNLQSIEEMVLDMAPDEGDQVRTCSPLQRGGEAQIGIGIGRKIMVVCCGGEQEAYRGDKFRIGS